MIKIEISNCEYCKFFKEIQSPTEGGHRCWLGFAPSDKDGYMTVDETEFGCIAWQDKKKVNNA